MKLLAIDPGNNESAYIVWNGDQIIDKNKIDNEILLEYLVRGNIEDWDGLDFVAIEMIASYGMPVGQSTFDTVLWTGRFLEKAQCNGYIVKLIFRKTIKLHHCGSVRAKDTNLRQALINKYGEDNTIKRPNPLYVTPNKTWMNTDLWAAFALATYWTENKKVSDYADSEVVLMSKSLIKYI